MAEIHLITGYLGSGKTQFLSRLLERKILREKIAVIVNDFGAVMFDGIKLQASSALAGEGSIEILDVPGGCLCCSAIEDFREALQNVISRGAERIFIEATGLADAEQVQRDLAFMRFPIDSTLCVVDALNIHRFRTLFHIVDAQIKAADFLLISKIDLAKPERVTALNAELDRINPRAVRTTLDNGRIETDMLIQAFASKDRFTPHVGEHPDKEHPHQEHLLQEHVTAFQVHLPQNIDYQAFEQALMRLPEGIVRLKGLARFNDSAAVLLVNYVAGAWNYVPLKQNEQTTELFAIGQNVSMDEMQSAFVGLEAQIEAGTVRSFGLVQEHHHH
jgi:G3E family GTPase